MKKIIMFAVSVFLLLHMAGCNNDDDVKDVPEEIPVEENGTDHADDTNQNQNQNQEQNQEQNQNQNQEQNENDDFPFNFTHFDLDVDYSDNQDYDIDYENEQDGMEAEIKDDRANNHLKGDEAFEVLRPKFEEFTFDANTPNEEVISEVLSAFDLADDYQEFELEVRFIDGTEKEYSSRQ